MQKMLKIYESILKLYVNIKVNKLKMLINIYIFLCIFYIF